MPSRKLSLLVLAVAFSGASATGFRRERRQSGVPYQLYVDAARESIHSGQVASNNAIVIAAQIATDLATEASVAAALAASQAEDASAIASFEAVIGGSLSDYADVNAKFALKQAAIAAASALHQKAVAAANEDAVGSIAAAAQAAANTAAAFYQNILNNAQLASPAVACSTATCLNVINGGIASCGPSGQCAYSCFAGSNPVYLPTYVSCLDTRADSMNCGSVGVQCRPPYNGIGSTTCVNGNCAVQCPAAYNLKFLSSGQQFCSK